MNLVNGKSILICPFCHKEQNESVINHCIIGNPTKSQSQCIHCGAWFTVLSINGDTEFEVIGGKLT